MCGTAVSSMVLQLRDEGGAPVAVLADDARKFGFYSPRSGMTLHVIDTDEASLGAQGWLEDVSKVQKYVMSDEDYARRENTYRRYKEERLRQDPGWTLDKEMARRKAGGPGASCATSSCPAPPASGAVVGDAAGTASQCSPEEEVAAAAQRGIAVGQRCSVEPGDRRGVVEFLGCVPSLAPGCWVGVCYDEPLGKNDGSVKGARYFSCPQNHGGFVRPDKVSVGDFPPLDDGLSDLGSDDEI